MRSGTTVHASASNVSRGGFLALAVSTVLAVIVISVGQSGSDPSAPLDVAADQIADSSTSQTASAAGAADSSASSLLDEVDGAQLFDAGARDDEAIEADGDASTEPAPAAATDPGAAAGPIPPAADTAESASVGGVVAGGASATAESETLTDSFPAPNESDAPDEASSAPSTAVPTTAAPTTAAPTTEAPTTTAAPTTAAPTTAAPTTEPTPPPTPSTSTPTEVIAPTAEQWAALRQCESGGRYDVVSPNGLYHGAYQFHQGTWNGVARSAGRDDLDGVAPSVADPADQDAMALVLWTQRGNQPWPVCGQHIPPKP